MSKQRDGSGISLRDYFAGQALAGLLARGVPDGTAIRRAYEIADAMLKAGA